MRNLLFSLLTCCTLFCFALDAQGQSTTTEAQDSLNSFQNDSIRMSLMLDSVLIQGSNVVRYADRDVWRITKKMRKGASNTAQMLGNLPGFDCNWITNSLSYYGRTNILVLVDSLEKPDEYVKKLHHMRFDKIDVITQPTGRYADYDVVVNLHTKPNYEGYEGDLSHWMNVLPTDGNGEGRNVNMLGETASFTYTKNKWNFVAWGKYFFNQREIDDDDFSSEQTYRLNQFKETSQSDTWTKNKGHKTNAYTALDYQINARHSLSLSYSYEGDKQQKDFLANMLRSNFADWSEELVTKKMASNTDDGRHTLGFYYRGKTRAWRYLLNFNYTHEDADQDMDFEQNESFSTENHEKNRMNYIWLNTEVNRNFFDNKFYVSAGYTYNWKDYEQHERLTGNLLSENTYHRHELWTWMSYSFNANTNANFSFSAQLVQTKTTGYHNNDMVYRVSGSLFHRFSKDIWVRLNCNSSVSYPQLSQVTNYGYFVDSLTYSTGNPSLKSNVEHTAILKGDFFNLLNLNVGLSLAPNQIKSIVESRYGLLPSGTEGYYCHTSPQNTYYRTWWVSLYVYKQIKNFRLSGQIEYDDYKAKFKEMGHHKGCVAGSFNARYYYEKYKLTLNASYRLQTFNTVSVQGWSEQRSDLFEVQFNKSFLNQRLNATLSYNLPLHFTKMKLHNVTSTPATETIENMRLRNRNDHAISISLSYKFYGGKSVRQYQREMKNEK